MANRLPASLCHAGVLRESSTGLRIISLNVKYRDFRYVIPFLVQFGLLCLAGRV